MPDFFRRRAFSVWLGRKQGVPDTTGELHKKAKTLKGQSVHAETDPVELAIHLMCCLEREYDFSLPQSLRVSLSLALEEVLFACGMFFSSEGITQANKEDELATREYLRSIIHFYETSDVSFDLLSETLEAAFSHVMGRLKRDATELLSDSPLIYDGPSLRVIDLVSDPAEMVNRIIRAFHCQEHIEGGYFKSIQAIFLRNTQKASGIYSDDKPKIRDHIMPPDYSYDDPGELVWAYLKDTPFCDLLLTPLPVKIPTQARLEHTHILGGSGHGKTSALGSLILDDLEAALEEPRTVIVMDSQGDLIESLLSREILASSALSERTIIIDPTEYDHPVAINPFALPARFEDYGPQDRERMLFSAVDLFEHFFSELMDAELTGQQGATFKYLIRLLLQIPNATLLTLREVMDSPEDFIPYMEQLDGAARLFFQREFMAGGYKQTRAQISKRIWQILANPVFERLFSSSENKVDWYEAMQNGSIILVNTAKEYLKTQNSALFGKLVMAQIAQGILERAIDPAGKRTPTFIYLDEAQEYVDPSVDLLLSQGRKYACGLTLAHQHLDQLNTSQRASFLANTSVKLAGGLNRKDAQVIAGETHSSPEFYTALEKRSDETQFGLFIRHQTSSAVPLTLPLGILNRAEQASHQSTKILLERSRLRYGQSSRQSLPSEPFKKPPPAPKPAPVTSEHPQHPQRPQKELKKAPETIPEPTQPSPPISAAPKQPASSVKTQDESDHRYLQNLIKGLAEKAGARASLEAPTDEGRIDVLIEKGAHSIAVEIGLSTAPEHELQNVRKCLLYGTDQIWVVTKGKRRLQNLKKVINAALSEAEQAKVHYFTVDALGEATSQLHDIPIAERSHRNYRVTVKTSGGEDVNRRRVEVAKILARSLKNKQ